MVEILTFDEELIQVRQPWLSEHDRLRAKIAPDFGSILREYSRDVPANFFTKYILTLDMKIVEEPNMLRWDRFLREPHRCLQANTLSEGPSRTLPDYRPGKVWISTVFVGATREDLFETMIFGGWLHGTQVRCDNYKEAMLTHKYAIDAAVKLNAWIKRNGRWAKKLHVRWERYWKLARKRGVDWALKHADAGDRMHKHIRSIPGQPPFPEPNILLSMCKTFLPRHDFHSDDIAV